ncbi:uncharacterized protein LOC107820949 isoform X2 [Nicotiana tabacum]|uniref:Uncharacterized protein LOC107820949 isoform X2 n=17 Tax=Nicotiana tabacum TaxID=4097 RepID=A0AC58UV96_TOBAC
MSATNIENRKKLKDPHTTGKKSFAIVRNDLAEMESIETQQSENGDESINIFASIMGPEYPGRLRLYGRGVTKKSLKGKVGHFEPSSNTINDHMQKMEERIIRLEEKIEEQKEQYEEQKTMMRQEIVKDIKEKVQCSGLPIDANILATLYSRPLGEASSTQAATIHLIHRPSLGSNNQGEENEQMGDESSEDLT